MAAEVAPRSTLMPTIVPLGDAALLVRFGDALTDEANRAALALAQRLEQDAVPGVDEVVPNLVSVLLRYDPLTADPQRIAGEVRLLMAGLDRSGRAEPHVWPMPVRYDGPDLPEVARALGLTPEAFQAAHGAKPIRVLATGFAPGFVYCGLHGPELTLPRRSSVRPSVPPGTVLFAAGQTAITATEMPTGWHVIGHTPFRNFNTSTHPPTHLAAGDLVRFEAIA